MFAAQMLHENEPLDILAAEGERRRQLPRACFATKSQSPRAKKLHLSAV
jgi:hypothetical protein